MHRRRLMLAWASTFLLAAALPSSADELAVSAGAAVATDVAPVDGAVVDGAAPGAACAGGACAGGLGAFGHPLTCIPRDYLNPHLFYQFYVGGNCGSIPAGMYPTPMPTPPLVGHTYFTYQPLLPHEYMYAHHRVYHHHYNHNRGLSRTRVIYAW
jgi:hypothetical protein